MKATYPRPFPCHPRFLRPKLPSQSSRTILILGLILALVLLIALWSAFQAEPSSATPVKVETGLELILSGVVTGTLSLGADELSAVQCSSTGFRLASTGRVAFPLEITFGVPASTNSSFYVFGSSDALALNIDGAAYTLLSGAVTTSPGTYTFNASFVDAQSQPLQLSGRLSCP